MLEKDKIIFFYDGGENIGNFKITDSGVLEIDIEYGDIFLQMERI